MAQKMMVSAGLTRQPIYNAFAYQTCEICDDCGICAFGMFCQPCIFGLTHDILYSGQPAEPCSTRCFNGCCVLYFLFGGLMCLPGCNGLNVYLACCQRSALRGKYTIMGGACGDCCAHQCCSICSLIQEFKEANIRSMYPAPAVMVAMPQMMMAAPMMVPMQQPMMMQVQTPIMIAN